MPGSSDDRRLQAIRNDVLELIAYGQPLSRVADVLCRRMEEIAPDARSSVLRLDEDWRLHPVAAPRLPASFSKALDGLRAGPRAGSCGTAVHRGEAVLARDISSDPSWSDYRSLVEPLGLEACWSSPIRARGGRVVGAFALYFTERRGPRPIERRLVETSVHLCAIAMEQDEARRRHDRLVHFDRLTGLPNRFRFDGLIEDSLKDSPEGFGLLLIDIDGLKITNDTMGNVVGDALIRQVAERIEQSVKPSIAYRIGGDEFAVPVSGRPPEAALTAAAEAILAAMTPSLDCLGHRITPQVSIGGAAFGSGGTDADTLRQNADLALQDAKASGRGGYLPFSRSLRTALTRRVEIIRALNSALDEGRVLPHYQPLMRIDTKEIVGLEALARMREPDGRIVSAGAFAEALADPQVAYRLTGQMLTRVASDIRGWLDLGIPVQHVGINVTTADFQKGDLAERITAAFGAARVPLRHVVLEVTETVFMDGADDRVADAVEHLRAQGLLVALDDFGTGFASLTHLLSFPVDIIKIDKSFVDRLLTDCPSEVIVKALVDIARQLNMRLVAEGIETAQQARRLEEIGCRLGQGFHFHKPAAFEEATALLLAHAQGGARPQRSAAAG